MSLSLKGRTKKQDLKKRIHSDGKSGEWGKGNNNIITLSGASSSARDLTPLDTGNWKNTQVAVSRWDILCYNLNSPQLAGQWHLIYMLKQMRPCANL